MYLLVSLRSSAGLWVRSLAQVAEVGPDMKQPVQRDDERFQLGLLRRPSPIPPGLCTAVDGVPDFFFVLELHGYWRPLSIDHRRLRGLSPLRQR